mgnify:CR=1 FL=1
MERANLWMKNGQSKMACRSFEKLSKRKGEVGLQAKLSVCSCAPDACATKACLQDLAQIPALRPDAESMIARTPTNNSCGTIKSDAPSNE